MLTEDELKAKLETLITPHRYAHSLNVMQTAVELAEIFGADIEKCRIAGLVHDCAKSLSKGELLELIEEAGIALYPGEGDMEQLLHAPGGAVFAKKELGITDPEVLSAIRFHTVGRENMSLTEAIIYVADFIEPGRKDFEGLKEVRELARRDIYAAVSECTRLSHEYCEQRGYPVLKV